MTIEDVLAYFGTKTEACKAIGLRRQNFAYWVAHGIPLVQQYRLQEVTKGVLMVGADSKNKKQSRRRDDDDC